MKPMIWHPEEKDARINAYLETQNRAPYALILAGVVLLFCLFTIGVALGSV
jgi:hypothetical protein